MADPRDEPCEGCGREPDECVCPDTDFDSNDFFDDRDWDFWIDD